ncbi:MAG: hypothetical protein LUD76_10055 [Alistipes sp.]|nr:hypothetical protein [Alistipes sp.]
MSDLLTLKKDVEAISDVVAAAVVKQIKPAADEISTRKAIKEFGKAWLEYHTTRGHVLPFRNGPHKTSPKVYSRRELLALKEAERRGAQMIIK